MPVPGYLGRILAGPDGPPAGTCFQLHGGVLVTAAHVLESIGADTKGTIVHFDALKPDLPAVCPATVAAVDPVHDLAVLTTTHRLPATVSLLATTDPNEQGLAVRVTGTADVPGVEHPHRYLETLGTWQGGTARDDDTSWGRLSCRDVMLGMSGAPVRRAGDDAVIGVVSGRYNSVTGWLPDSVWIARTEDLRPLLAGLTDLTVQPAPLTGAVDLLLTVAERTVRLTGAGHDITADHAGVREGLRAAVVDARRERARSPRITRTATQSEVARPDVVSLRRAGRMLAESFLPTRVADALGDVLRQADRQRLPVRLGIHAPDWPWLPWEALTDPVEQHPIALHPLVTLYRHQDAPPVQPMPGPLQIVVAIAAPDSGGPLLDYENELRNVHAAVRGARLGQAQVRVVPFATTAALRAELQAAPAHVLHLSGHGSPGQLVLETETGAARPVTAETFLAEAIPPGRMPPVICLAACHTAAPAGPGSASFAAELVAHGASVVIGTETSVTDTYATRVFSRVYAELAQADNPDVIAALADARRTVQRDLTNPHSKRDTLLAGLDEWSVVTVLAAAGSVTILDRTHPNPPQAVPGHDRDRHAGLLQREVGEFVGRRREQRTLPNTLLAPEGVGVVLHGIGGIGKTTLAAELIQLITRQEPHRLVAVATGELSVDVVLRCAANALRLRVNMTGETGQARQAVDFLARTDEPWQDRWQVLRTLMPHYPLLLVLDNFEDNLAQDHQLYDASLAELLTTWIQDCSTSRLLITSRFEFDLAQQALQFHAIGPMSLAETLKLAWSLPAVDRLPDVDLERVWRLVGGHPRTLEYLDALLAGGHARFADVTEKMTAAVQDLFQDDAVRVLTTSTTLDVALAVSLTLAADNVLLPSLLASLDSVPDARRVLLGLAVYREPVDEAAALFQIADPDPTATHSPNRTALNERIKEILTEAGVATDKPLAWEDVPPHLREQLKPVVTELYSKPTPPLRPREDLAQLLDVLRATSLLTTGPDGDGLFVHRWTASELERFDHNSDGSGAVGRHRAAAAYWRWRVAAWPQHRDADLHDRLEARYHLMAAGDLDEAATIAEQICARLDKIGAWDAETELVYDTLRHLPADSPRRAIWILQMGILAQQRGDYAEAERRYQQSLTITKQLGDQIGMISSYHQLGTLAQMRGDYPEAERRYQQSLTITKQLGDQARMATNYHNLGILAQERGNYPEGEHLLQQSLTIAEQLGDQARMATNYHNLGIVAQERGDYLEAERLLQQSLTIKERQGNQIGMANTYLQLGILAQMRGDYPEAERRHQRSLTIKERLGNQTGMANCYHQLGILAQMRGDYPEAERRYQQSLTITKQLGDQAGISKSYSQLGRLRAAQDMPEEAVVLQSRSFLIRLKMQSPDVARNIAVLRQLRATLGEDAFRRIAATVLDESDVDDLQGFLDQPEEQSPDE
jgi:tetratricopeptide (TPR) repeat protein